MARRPNAAQRRRRGVPPLVVIEGRGGILGQPMAVALAAARREGWEIVRGWAPPEGSGFVCTGPIRVPDDARRAFQAAAGGAGLVVAASAGRLTVDRFLDDLRGLGPVEHLVERAEPRPILSDGQRALLGLLVEGLTVDEAAAALRVSRRAATWDLAATRKALGVDSTAEGLAAVLATGSPAGRPRSISESASRPSAHLEPRDPRDPP